MGTVPTDARTLLPGTRLGNFALGPRIARGGMAELYLACTHGRDGFEKLVALKLVLPQYKDDEQFLAMLRNEARIAATLEHPNIASVYDLGSASGEHFIAMEYVHGRSVAEILQQVQGPMPLGCALALVERACDAVHHAHTSHDARGRPQALIHRDISPSNVLVRYDGVVKLVDFGIARATARTRATKTGTVKGKVGYMSPEQCLDDTLDRRTDVFALGVLLYELSMGRRLFVAGSDFAVMNRIISSDYERPRQIDPDFPPGLEAIIDRALAPDRDRRHASAAALGEALVEFSRAEQLDTSTVALARWMHDHFEVPPPPVVSAEALHQGPAAAMPNAMPKRRIWRAVPYVAVAACAGLIGFLYRPVDPAPARAAPTVLPAGPVQADPLEARAPTQFIAPPTAAVAGTPIAASRELELQGAPTTPSGPPSVPTPGSAAEAEPLTVDDPAKSPPPRRHRRRKSKARADADASSRTDADASPRTDADASRRPDADAPPRAAEGEHSLLPPSLRPR